MSGPSYDVFLSFRGPDTRDHFADFLYKDLTESKIDVFRDEEKLERGKEIYPQLIQAIKQSKLSIPVISKEYASSKSCLMELEQMVKCMDRKNHTIIPIFYHVDPSDVRNCCGPFRRALNEPQKRALHRIGKLVGYHRVKRSDQKPSIVIKKIVRQVELKVKKRNLIVPKQLVGIDPHVQEIMAKLKLDCSNGKVKIGDTCAKVLIYGIPGVGKTVLAKFVYNKINHLYDACSFLEDIQGEIKREHVRTVQNRLISHLHKGNAQKFSCSDFSLTHIQKRFRDMKVLLLLDDVKDCGQLGELVGELDWLCPGSTVIVTSQRNDVLQKVKDAERFGLGTMQKDKALQLFCWHAFGTDSPPEQFKDQSTEIVAATDGLPLALVNVGQSLSNVKDSKVWTETPIALKQAPEPNVQEAFFKCYNTLRGTEKDIFLDIACFFIGKDQRIPYYMWEACKFFPSRSFLSLRAMSLVEIGEDDKLRMHKILKTFGREIVENESKKEPWRRSRLRKHEDSLDVLKRNKGTEIVEALRLKFADRSAKDTIKCDTFDGLQNLRFLNLDQADIEGKFEGQLSKLSWLDWRGCPKIIDVQSLNLNLQELLILDLSWSQVDNDWMGWELLKLARKLKVLNLTGCVQLFATPKFPPSMLLERLILEGSSNLEFIDPSFKNLKTLVSLNMKGCSLLGELPDLGPMEDLEELVIDGTSISQIDFQEGSMMKLETLSARNCEHLTYICDSIRYLNSLKYLALDGSGIHTLPISIGLLEKLQILSLKNCGNLSSLQSLDLSHTKILELPPSVKDLKAMKVLRMR